MVGGQPQGNPVAIPAEFDSAYVDQSLSGGVVVSTTRTAAWLHYGDLPAGVMPAPGDRLIVAAPSPDAGTYTIDSLEPNSDNTGVMLRLKRGSPMSPPVFFADTLAAAALARIKTAIANAAPGEPFYGILLQPRWQEIPDGTLAALSVHSTGQRGSGLSNNCLNSRLSTRSISTAW